jgi:hypothetical protein
MKKEALVEIINGRNYRDEMNKEEEQIAKESGLIVIFGASDDLTEFRGAINDELDATDGAIFIIALPGTEVLCDDDGETYRKAKKLEAIQVETWSLEQKNRVESVWCPDELDCSWLIKTDLPHASFDIMEDGELYCRGVVIDVLDL